MWNVKSGRLFAAVLMTASVALAGQAVPARDERIVVPVFQVQAQPLGRALEILEQASMKADSEGRGVRILNLTKPSTTARQVTLSATNQSVRQIADTIGSNLVLWVRSKGDTVEVWESGTVKKNDWVDRLKK
jgi:hypothetical protein